MEWDGYNKVFQARLDNCHRMLSYAVVGFIPAAIFASSILVDLNVTDFDKILLANTFRPHEFFGEPGFNVTERSIEGGALFTGIIAARDIIVPAFLFWFIFAAIAWRKFAVIGRTMAWAWVALALLTPNSHTLQIQRTFYSNPASAKLIVEEARPPSKSKLEKRSLGELGTQAQIAWINGDKAKAKALAQESDWDGQWLRPEMQDRRMIMLGRPEARTPLCYVDTLCLPLGLAKAQQIIALSILITNIIILFFTLWLSQDLKNRRGSLLDRYSRNARSIRSEYRQNSMIGAT